MKKQKILRIMTILLPLAAALLSALPWAVKLNFATPEERLVEYFSAFSMTPVGYAVWGAMAGGIGAIVLTVLAVVTVFKEDAGITNAMLTIAMIAAVMCLSTTLFGNMTILGGIITALLAADAVLLYYLKKQTP